MSGTYNCLAVFYLFITSLTVGITSITILCTTNSHFIFHNHTNMFFAIIFTIFSFAPITNSLFTTGCSSTYMTQSHNLLCTTFFYSSTFATMNRFTSFDCTACFFINCKLGVPFMPCCHNHFTRRNFCLTFPTICVPCIAIIRTSCSYLISHFIFRFIYMLTINSC